MPFTHKQQNHTQALSQLKGATYDDEDALDDATPLAAHPEQ